MSNSSLSLRHRLTKLVPTRATLKKHPPSEFNPSTTATGTEKGTLCEMGDAEPMVMLIAALWARRGYNLHTLLKRFKGAVSQCCEARQGSGAPRH